VRIGGTEAIPWRQSVRIDQHQRWDSWVVAGHIVSRTLRDTVAALDATSGPMPGDFISLPKRTESFLSSMATSPRKLRIAVCTRFKNAPATDPDCVRTAMEAAQHLQDLGHIVEEVVPDISYDEMSGVCFELFLPGMAEGVLAVSAATGTPADEHHLEPHTLATVEYAKTRSALDFRKALNRMVWMSREMARFHERYDALLTPAVAQLPCDIGVYQASRYAGTGVDYWDIEGPLYAFSPLASVTGQPAIVLPFPIADCALPAGIQLSTAIGDETTLFQLSAQIEATHPWSHLSPAIHAAS
jgi:amidase